MPARVYLVLGILTESVHVLISISKDIRGGSSLSACLRLNSISSFNVYTCESSSPAV